jgi:hypothetical protein
MYNSAKNGSGKRFAIDGIIGNLHEEQGLRNEIDAERGLTFRFGTQNPRKYKGTDSLTVAVRVRY